jgi:TatD DNase family protein
LNLVDTHCHLDFDRFNADRSEVLDRAAQAGVSRILIPGISWQSSKSAVQLAEKHEILYAAIGIHPTEASELDMADLNNFRELAINPKVKAIGEIGLDYYWNRTTQVLQQKILMEQLVLAGEMRLPVVIHFREKGDAPDGPCAADLMMLLQEWVAGLQDDGNKLAERPGVLHSFSGSRETAEQAISMNFFLGVTGPVTYRKDRQELITHLPIEKLLVETDAPFLPPAPHRGKRNEPAFVTLITDKIAALKQCNPEQAAAIVTENAGRLFAWNN